VAHCYDLSLCDDHEVALRNRGLDALCDQQDAMCALACRMNEQACRRSALDDLPYRKNVLAYRMILLGALCDQQDAMCALACRMSALACRMILLDALCDQQDVMCALAYRKNVLAYQMNALELNLHRVDAQIALVNDALDARYALKQTSLHESLALVGHPFRRHALMRSDVGCPLVRLRSPLT
jgi:hypothetical protein